MTAIDEQQEYYRQRAPEYDEWWQARGRYAKTPGDEARWFSDVRETDLALAEFGPSGRALELAAGTGWWTQRLARYADRVTAVDGSPEALAINRAKNGDAVEYVRADLFAWEPPQSAFDVVFFGYWLSHVPEDRLPAFWDLVATALKPGGRVFLVDSYHTARLPGDLQVRVLNDGRRFEIVKRYWQPGELAASTAALGWNLTATVATNEHIIYAHGSVTPPE